MSSLTTLQRSAVKPRTSSIQEHASYSLGNHFATLVHAHAVCHSVEVWQREASTGSSWEQLLHCHALRGRGDLSTSWNYRNSSSSVRLCRCAQNTPLDEHNNQPSQQRKSPPSPRRLRREGPSAPSDNLAAATDMHLKRSVHDSLRVATEEATREGGEAQTCFMIVHGSESWGMLRGAVSSCPAGALRTAKANCS